MSLTVDLLFFLTIIGSGVSCPLKTVNSRSGCYCGIEVDGTNYIRCQPYSIETIPEFTRSYVYDTLNLSFNFIRRINNQSWDQLKVKKIVLEQNLIESIEKNAFNHPILNYLEELRLDMITNGSLEFLCYGQWSKLRFLKLNGFNFNSFQSCLEKFHRLETLIIVNSQLDQLTYHIYQLPNLIDLTLIHSQMEYLRFDSIDDSPLRSSIRRLNLTANQLRTIPNDLFQRLPQLILLDLSHNFIENLPILPLTSSLHVNLSENFIQYVQLSDNQHHYDLSFNPICTIEKTSSTTNLFIRDSTHLHCDCRLAYFLLKDNQSDHQQLIGTDQPFGNQTKCSSPDQFDGMFLKDLTYQQLFSICTSNLPEHCREVTLFKQIETYLARITTKPTTTTTTTTIRSERTSTSVNIEDSPSEIASLRLSTFFTTYENNDLIITWNFDPSTSAIQMNRIQFQIIVEQESPLNTEIIRRSGLISPYLKEYIISHIPPNKTYYVCLLLSQTSYGTDKYCREIRTKPSMMITSSSSTTSVPNFVSSKHAFVHLLFTNRSIMFGFLIGTILTTGLLLTLAVICHLRAKREHRQRVGSSLFHYQQTSPPNASISQEQQQQQQQQLHYLYADRRDDEEIYSNSLLSSPKYNHCRKTRRRTYLPSNQSWYRRGLTQIPTVPSAPRCCFHHQHTPDTTISSSSTTARRMTTLSSQYSNAMDREPMTSTSIMSSTSLDDQQSQHNALSPSKHVYEELTDEGTLLKRNHPTDFFL